MDRYADLQKTYLAMYDQGLTSINSEKNFSTVTAIKSDINYLSKGLDIAADYYRGDRQAPLQIAQHASSRTALDRLSYNTQAATCSLLGGGGSSTAMDDMIANVYPSLQLTSQAG